MPDNLGSQGGFPAAALPAAFVRPFRVCCSELGGRAHLLQDLAAEDQLVWYCMACEKHFKSEAALDNHERSRKHLLQVDGLGMRPWAARGCTAAKATEGPRLAESWRAGTRRE